MERENNMTRISDALARHRDRVKNGEEGFTLIELLVVVIIIGILAAIAIPVYIGVQNNAKDSAVKTDLTNAKTAVIAYYTDNGTGSTVADPVLASLTAEGYTKSSDTTAIDFVGDVSSTGFCIQATSSTTETFRVTATSGVEKGTCPTA
jgi:type IV pilus assembly protein PilA